MIVFENFLASWTKQRVMGFKKKAPMQIRRDELKPELQECIPYENLEEFSNEVSPPLKGDQSTQVF